MWNMKEKSQDDPADGSNHPEYSLRFNGARDIIVFHFADWEAQEAVAKISERQGRVPVAFLQMEHVGISISSFATGHRLRGGGHHGSYGVSEARCDCSTDACRDVCQFDPLPHFLSCFPSLKSFYIARVAHKHEDFGDEETGATTVLENADCHCGTSKDGEIASGLNHNWPNIKSSDLDRWCVVWDERTGCIPAHGVIGNIRHAWRPNFPYYKELEHLNIRFIRRMDPGGICE
ncbi:hypothetical protein GQ53DRAFT_832561 [Thozetella sp. PMI_491]|nr:hypothetical protein GQ53DRAFT_832561 [Thozetella sp. PMI_491]